MTHEEIAAVLRELPLNAIIRTDGTWEERLPRDGREYTFEELWDAVGGAYYQLVRLADGWWLVCDEMGRLRDLPLNPVATALYLRGRPGSRNWIAGDVLVCEDRLLS